MNGKDPSGHQNFYTLGADTAFTQQFNSAETEAQQQQIVDQFVTQQTTSGSIALGAAAAYAAPGMTNFVATRYPTAFGIAADFAMAEVGMTVRVAGVGAGAVIGKWAAVGETMKPPAARYQKFATGVEVGKALFVNGVKFDGITKSGILLEAKGPGLAKLYEYALTKGGNWKAIDELVDQALRQVAAAKGAPIEWRFAEQKAAEIAKKVFAERGIKGINVRYHPESSGSGKGFWDKVKDFLGVK